jgi:Flp pilus assembly protein TadB
MTSDLVVAFLLGVLTGLAGVGVLILAKMRGF